MFDTTSTKALLGPADPVRGVRISPPHARAVDIIALAEATADLGAPSGVRRRRMLVPVAAGVVAAGLIAATLVANGLTGADPSSGTAGQTTGPTRTRTGGGPPLTLGPVIQPVAFQIDQRPPAAGDELRALAAQLAPGRCDITTGKYTLLRTVGWNAVFDDLPGGKAQRIIPSERREWSAPDGSARIRTKILPTVYPNEESYQYFQKNPVEPTATRTPAAGIDDLPANPDRAKPPLPTDPAEIAKRIDGKNPFRTVGDWSSDYAVPLATRAELLRILAKTPGVVWRGESTDRVGRKGVAVSLDLGETQDVLIFDPRTGEMLARDEVERPTDTVAGATLVLGCEHTDQLG